MKRAAVVLFLLAACSTSSSSHYPISVGFRDAEAPDAGDVDACALYEPHRALCIDAGSVNVDYCACQPIGPCSPCPPNPDLVYVTVADPGSGVLYCTCGLRPRDAGGDADAN